MSEFAVMPITDYVGMCDTVREKTGDAETIKSGEMSDKISAVYEKGQQAEYDKFWDAFQNKGEEQNYYFAFSYNRFTDENYNPKYDIICGKNSTVSSRNMFQGASYITDTKVKITASTGSTIAMFQNAVALETIRQLTVFETTTFNNTFYNCTKLKNIVMDGVIGNNISFAYSPLTVDSMKSIISHLKDYSGTSSTYTLTFKADRKTMLTDEEKAEATNKGWTLVWS